MKTLQSRNISDMSLVSEYKLPLDTGGFYSAFKEIAVDPVRPFLYVIRTIRDNNVGGITELIII